ncbi:DUF4199 domain-containing protein [Flavobacteriaceae bacterium F08102]|nr:DUF4199 domain-containing protein [Flavobacteriaceae bacterium F08102]
MEHQKPNTKPIILNYGLILGVLSVLLSVIVYAFGNIYNQGILPTIASFAISISVIALAISAFKKLNGGYLNFSDGLKIGIGASLIGAIITIIYSLIFTRVIEPDFTKNMMEIQMQEYLKNPDITDEMIDGIKKGSEFFSQTWVVVGIQLIVALFIGFIISLIATLAMQKKEEF